MKVGIGPLTANLLKDQKDKGQSVSGMAIKNVVKTDKPQPPQSLRSRIMGPLVSTAMLQSLELAAVSVYSRLSC